MYISSLSLANFRNNTSEKNEFSQNTNVNSDAKEQGKTFEACYRDIMPVVNFLRQAISIVGQKIEYNKNITFDPDFSDSSSMLFSEPPKKYLDIVRIIAQAEQKNLIDRKQNFIDYEELLSV